MRDMSVPETKRTRLDEAVRAQGRLVVAYSGGVDSTFLASVAHEVLGPDSVAVTAVSPALAREELAEAKRIASERGWNHRIVRTNELNRDEYTRNSGDRCFWCKVELFDVIGPLAQELDASVAVGTNFDDLSDYRPGRRAALERGVLSPLADVGLTKAEIRELSRAMGLPTAEKPAGPCLSSRLAYGVEVTPQRLRRVEGAETFIKKLGFEVVRVRDLGDEARVEVGRDEVPRALELSRQIVEHLLALGFSDVEVDPDGYRMGSLNLLLPAVGGR